MGREGRARKGGGRIGRVKREPRQQNGDRLNFIRCGFNAIRGTPFYRNITLEFTLHQRDSTKFGLVAKAKKRWRT